MAKAPKLTVKFKMDSNGMEVARRTLEAAAEELRACGVGETEIESAVSAAFRLVMDDLMTVEIDEGAA